MSSWVYLMTGSWDKRATKRSGRNLCCFLPVLYPQAQPVVDGAEHPIRQSPSLWQPGHIYHLCPSNLVASRGIFQNSPYVLPSIPHFSWGKTEIHAIRKHSFLVQPKLHLHMFLEISNMHLVLIHILSHYGFSF